MEQITVDFELARENMVENLLKPGGVRDKNLCHVLRQIPREAFMPDAYRNLAYMERPIPLAENRILPNVLPFALLVEMAAVQPTDLILDIACANGYSTAVLAALGSAVVGLEQDGALATQAETILQEQGIDNAVIVCATHKAGMARQGPYNVIVINGYVPELPDTLLAQLDEGGRLVCFTTYEGSRRGVIAHRQADGSIDVKAGFESMAPPVPGFEKTAAFSF